MEEDALKIEKESTKEKKESFTHFLQPHNCTMEMEYVFNITKSEEE